MRLTTTLLVAAIGVSAHPSGHAHLHRAVHGHNNDHLIQKRDDGQVIYATIDGKVVSWTMGGSPFKAAHKPTTIATTLTTSTVAAVPAPATTSTTAPAAPTTTAVAVAATPAAASSSTKAAAAAASSPSSSSSSSGSSSGSGASSYESFGSCSKKRATAANIAYAGNTGCNGYGSNMKLVQESIASKYEYVVKAVSSGDALTCVAWNKIGPSGGINGFFSGNQALSFSIPAGGAQYVAFDANTQGGMCCSSGGSVPTTSVGEFLCPWLEFDFADAANNGWSGFDASALVAGSAGGPFGALKACTADGSVCSTLNAGGGGSNAYLPGDEAADGIGGNLAPGSVSLIATW